MTEEEIHRRLAWLEREVARTLKLIIFGFSILAVWVIISIVEEGLAFKLPGWGVGLTVGVGAMLLTGIIGHITFKDAPTSVQIILEKDAQGRS